MKYSSVLRAHGLYEISLRFMTWLELRSDYLQLHLDASKTKDPVKITPSLTLFDTDVSYVWYAILWAGWVKL